MGEGKYALLLPDGDESPGSLSVSSDTTSGRECWVPGYNPVNVEV